jgi:hypothetical protein
LRRPAGVRRLEEVTALADRLLVLHNGTHRGEVDPARDAGRDRPDDWRPFVTFLRGLLFR